MSKTPPRSFAVPTVIFGHNNSDYVIEGAESGSVDEHQMAIARLKGAWVVRNGLEKFIPYEHKITPVMSKRVTRFYGATLLVSSVRVLGQGPREGYKNFPMPALDVRVEDRPTRKELISGSIDEIDNAQNALVDLVNGSQYRERTLRSARGQVSKSLGRSSMYLAAADAIDAINAWEQSLEQPDKDTEAKPEPEAGELDPDVGYQVQKRVKTSAIRTRKNAVNFHNQTRHTPCLSAIADQTGLVNHFAASHLPQVYRSTHASLVLRSQDIPLVKEKRVA